jgi:HAD superfamily hydrolase (TIGR01509 family)
MYSKIIVLDVDGVLLDWLSPFKQWMEGLGYSLQEPHGYNLMEAYSIDKSQLSKLKRHFNDSETIRSLPALPGAKEALMKLKALGYQLCVLTKLSSSLQSQSRRKLNLNDHFGLKLFERINILDVEDSKEYSLKELASNYPNAWIIEDAPENIALSEKAGLKPILFEHDYNLTTDCVYRINHWDKIDALIVDIENN